MIHIVNRGWEEETFMERRIHFMKEQAENTVFLSDMSEPVESCLMETKDKTLFGPIRAVTSLKIKVHQNRGGRILQSKIRKRFNGR